MDIVDEGILIGVMASGGFWSMSECGRPGTSPPYPGGLVREVSNGFRKFPPAPPMSLPLAMSGSRSLSGVGCTIKTLLLCIIAETVGEELSLA